jgi:multidrug resistance efflux pump
MRKLTFWFAAAALLFALNPTQLKAESDNNLRSIETAKAELGMITSTETSKALIAVTEAEMSMFTSAEAVETAYANALLDRLNEINEMDMSAMSSSEKNELRKEVRAIQKEQRPTGGVYISVGAAILIVLLLILLL